MVKKIVYVNPGDMVEFRIVPHGSEKTSAGWRDQSRPGHLLTMINGEFSISLADPQASVDDWMDAARRNEAAKQAWLNAE